MNSFNLTSEILFLKIIQNYFSPVLNLCLDFRFRQALIKRPLPCWLDSKLFRGKILACRPEAGMKASLNLSSSSFFFLFQAQPYSKKKISSVKTNFTLKIINKIKKKESFTFFKESLNSWLLLSKCLKFRIIPKANVCEFGLKFKA